MSCLTISTTPSSRTPLSPGLLASNSMSSQRGQRPHPRLQRHHQPPLASLTMPPASLTGAASSLASQMTAGHSHSRSNSTPHSSLLSLSTHNCLQHQQQQQPHASHSNTMSHPHPPVPGVPAHSSSLPSANPFSPSTHPTRSVTEIIPRLYISDLSFAENPACLSSHRITHVLSTLPEQIYIPPATLLHPHPPPQRLQIAVEDFPFAELAAHLPKTTAWITDALSRDSNARVLVHCVEGISRSVSVVAAYLMSHFGWTPNEAVKFIKSKRVVAEPNFGFVQQLHEYARDSLGKKC